MMRVKFAGKRKYKNKPKVRFFPPIKYALQHAVNYYTLKNNYSTCRMLRRLIFATVNFSI